MVRSEYQRRKYYLTASTCRVPSTAFRYNNNSNNNNNDNKRFSYKGEVRYSTCSSPSNTLYNFLLCALLTVRIIKEVTFNSNCLCETFCILSLTYVNTVVTHTHAHSLPCLLFHRTVHTISYSSNIRFSIINMVNVFFIQLISKLESIKWISPFHSIWNHSHLYYAHTPPKSKYITTIIT